MSNACSRATDAVDSLVMYCEGLFLEPYNCPAGVRTIGFGHTGPTAHENRSVSRQEAVNLLMGDMREAYDYLAPIVSTELEPHQLGALMSLTFNVGIGNVAKSKTLKALNSRHFGNFDMESAVNDPALSNLTGMAKEWAGFRRANGKIFRGLVLRRAYELQLFFNKRWYPVGENVMPQVVEPEVVKPRLIRPGMEGDQIIQLHEALGVAGYSVPMERAYTWATSRAVSAFQEAHGLHVDGLYGPQTARKLNEVLDHLHRGQ